MKTVTNGFFFVVCFNYFRPSKNANSNLVPYWDISFKEPQYFHVNLTIKGLALHEIMKLLGCIVA